MGFSTARSVRPGPTRNERVNGWNIPHEGSRVDFSKGMDEWGVFLEPCGTLGTSKALGIKGLVAPNSCNFHPT